jgi:pimeloyl-ACP methyl ester carboxylesterase
MIITSIVNIIDTTIANISSKLLKANVVNLPYHISNEETSHVHLLDIKGYGSHPTIILVHGLGSCGNKFHKLILHLKKICKRIIVFDLIGHGKTPVPVILKNLENENNFSEIYTDCTIKMLGSILTNYINTPNEKSILLGNSLGGLIVAKTALQYNHLIHCIFLSASVSNIKETDMQKIIDTFDVHTSEKAIELIKKLYIHHKNDVLFHFYKFFIIPFIQLHITNNETVQNILKSIYNTKFLTVEEYKELQKKLPIYVLFGQKDNILPHSCFDFFKDNLEKDSKTFLDYHPDFGHTPFLENPKQLVSILENFLDKI